MCAKSGDTQEARGLPVCHLTAHTSHKLTTHSVQRDVRLLSVSVFLFMGKVLSIDLIYNFADNLSLFASF